MKLEEVKANLKGKSEISFRLPDGTLVPRDFHVTEVGKISKHFIDCGGTIRKEEVANFQLWQAPNDYDHRLHPDKLINIIELSQDKLELGNLEVEVEYQGETIGKYGLDHDQNGFVLTSKKTDCLAKENCGVPEKVKLDLASIPSSGGCCSPDTGCC